MEPVQQYVDEVTLTLVAGTEQTALLASTQLVLPIDAVSVARSFIM